MIIPQHKQSVNGAVYSIKSYGQRIGQRLKHLLIILKMKKSKLSPEEIQKKREEAERKARRGEIDPMQEFAFQVIGQVLQ